MKTPTNRGNTEFLYQTLRLMTSHQIFGIQQIEMAEYVNEQPARGDTNKTERRMRLIALIFGILCIVQASLNVALRLTLYSRKESNPLNCSSTRNQDSVEDNCKTMSRGQCNDLQERFNHLTREKNLLQNQRNELINMIRRLKGEIFIPTELRGQRGGSGQPPLCPADWWEIDSRCYFLSAGSKTWDESRVDCWRRGADLVVIGSEEEQRALYQLGGEYHLLTWIGLTNTTGTFKWVDGSALTEPFWDDGQPDRGGPNNREDCVEMSHFHPVQACWNDAPCGHRQRWLCEKDPAN